MAGAAPGFDPAADVEAFLRHLAVARRLSPHTLDAYRRDLRRLLAWVEEARLPGWQALATEPLRGLVAREFRRGLSGRSLARWLAALRSFCRWLLREGAIAHNPAAGLRAPRGARRLPRVLDADAMAAFLDGIGAGEGEAGDGDAGRAARDRALFELAYSSGLRVSELVGARWRDADAGLTELRVAGKGGKTRVVPVGSAARAALAAWRELTGGGEFIFPGRAGGHLAVRTVQARLHRLGQAQGLAQRLHPHLLRHSCASHVLESSQDLRGVQELLGHADIATTQVYTHLDFQHLARVYDAAHPRARRKPG